VPDGQLLWGDLHVHTAASFDAFLEGVRTTPDQAYAFARGEAVDVPGAEGQPPLTVQLDRPLDFAAVTDHAEYFAETRGCSDPTSPMYDTATCSGFRADGSGAINTLGYQFSVDDPQRQSELCGAEYDCDAAADAVWAELVAAAEAAYDRTESCELTTFAGYEWSGTTGVANLHRNVIFAGETVPLHAHSYFDDPDPAGLWRALDRDCRGQDCDVVVIPHNSNQSNGTLFVPPMGLDGVDVELATLRSELEVLFEVYQHKGSSECVNQDLGGVLGAPDEACRFENLRPTPLDDCGGQPGGGGMIGTGCAAGTDYLRGVLMQGLQLQESTGLNAHRMGVIASTDTHLGTPGLVAEDAYVGHTGAPEGTPELRLEDPGLRPRGIRTSPGGLVGVWAESNDREAVFAALQRRETIGTSGPRIGLRLFAGWDLPSDLCDGSDGVARARAVGTAMGGTLGEGTDPAGPVFWVAADADPGAPGELGTPLQTLQIISGWYDDLGIPHVNVHDVAGGDTGASVDASCAPTGDGADRLCATWRDPDWEAGRAAWYYARVLENPSCRWSTRQCDALPPDLRPAVCDADLVQRTIAERAWSSPIWTR